MGKLEEEGALAERKAAEHIQTARLWVDEAALAGEMGNVDGENAAIGNALYHTKMAKSEIELWELALLAERYRLTGEPMFVPIMPNRKKKT